MNRSILLNSKSNFLSKILSIIVFKTSIILKKIYYFFLYIYMLKDVKNSYENVFIDNGVTIGNSKNLDLGCNLFIGRNCHFNCISKVSIGSGTIIAMDVKIFSYKHDTKKSSCRLNSTKIPSPVVIQENVWIGTGAIILGGVTVGKNSVIGAGSIVRKDVPQSTVYVGS